LDTGRRPFLVNSAGRIPVPLVRSATGAGPHPISQRNEGIEVAADMTQFGRGKPAVNMMHVGPMPVGNLMQDVHKAPKAQISDFAAPQRRHAPQLQVLQVDRVIPGTEVMGQFPVPILPLMRNPGMGLCQSLPCVPPTARAWHGPGQCPIGFAELAQRLFERLGCGDIMAVVSGEKLRKPEIKASGLTRLDPDKRRILTDTGEHDDHTPGRQAFDGERFDGPDNVSGVMESIEPSKEPETIATVIAPAGLTGCDRSIPTPLCR
jgi:hypothetical protein